MVNDAAVRRYRTCYATLLRLYPRLFQEQFAEGMAQTFHDLCRERRNAGRRLFGFVLGVYSETSLEIVRENTTQMTQMQKTVLRVALAALGLLMVPLIASRVVEGWNWGPGAFVFTYVLFFGTGMAYALISRKMKAWPYKAAVGLALVAGFVLGWASMVHMSETENPVNLVYFGVLAVGAVGAALARLEARGMARALFAMASIAGGGVADYPGAVLGHPGGTCVGNRSQARRVRAAVRRIRTAVPARESGEFEVEAARAEAALVGRQVRSARARRKFA